MLGIVRQVIKRTFESGPFITAQHGVVCSFKLVCTFKSCEVLDRIKGQHVICHLVKFIHRSWQWEFVEICRQSSHHCQCCIDIIRIEEFHQEFKECRTVRQVVLVSRIKHGLPTTWSTAIGRSVHEMCPTTVGNNLCFKDVKLTLDFCGWIRSIPRIIDGLQDIFDFVTENFLILCGVIGCLNKVMFSGKFCSIYAAQFRDWKCKCPIPYGRIAIILMHTSLGQYNGSDQFTHSRTWIAKFAQQVQWVDVHTENVSSDDGLTRMSTSEGLNLDIASYAHQFGQN